MSTYDFSGVDFSAPETITSLAKVYAVLCEVISQDKQQEEHQDRGEPKQIVPKKHRSKKLKQTAYVQLRLL
jgi:hypothetical protein